MNKVVISRSDLMSVESPGRYVGGEYGQVIKEDIIAELEATGKCSAVRTAFCFPDIYEIGMSNLAMQILYKCLNDQDFCYCERVFSPWLDMDKVMLEALIFSIESVTEKKGLIPEYTLQAYNQYSLRESKRTQERK